MIIGTRAVPKKGLVTIIEKYKISTRQLSLILLGAILGNSVIYVPSIRYAGQFGWLSNIMAIFFGLAYFFFLSKFVELLKGKSLVGYCLGLFGAIWGRIIILPLILYLFLDVSLVLKGMGLMLTTFIYEETPLIFLSILVILTTAYGLKKGVEVIARNCEIVVPYLIFILSLLLLMITFNIINYDNLKPLFPTRVIPVFRGVLPIIAFPILDSVFLLFLLPLINKPKPGLIYRGLAAALLLGGGFLTLRPLIVAGAFGPTEASNMTFPIINAVRLIQFGDFVERLESVTLPISITSSYVKVLILYYITTVSLTEFFGLKDYQPFIFPLGLILAAFSELVLVSTEQILIITKIVWFPLSLIPALIIPLLLFITGKIKSATK